jgi:hypothetical protein
MALFKRILLVVIPVNLFAIRKRQDFNRFALKSHALPNLSSVIEHFYPWRVGGSIVAIPLFLAVFMHISVLVFEVENWPWQPNGHRQYF